MRGDISFDFQHEYSSCLPGLTKPGDIRFQLTTWTQPSHRLGEYGVGCTNFCCDSQGFYVVVKSFMLLLKIVLIFNGYKLE